VFYDLFVGDERATFWRDALFVLPANDTIEAAHHVPLWVKKTPLIAAVSGIVIATLVYGTGGAIARFISKIFKPIHALFFNKYYFDELYHTIFQRPAIALGHIFFKGGDQKIINRFGPDGLATISRGGAGWLSKIQSGYVYHYAFVMMVGLIGLVSCIFWKMVM